MLCGSEAWSLRAEGVYRFRVFDHYCLCSIGRSGWNERVNNVQVRDRVLGISSENIMQQHIQLNRLHLLGHRLRMASTSLSHCLIFNPYTKWRKACGGQEIKWQY